MGNGMNKVLPGLYIGNYRDSKDPQQLDKHQITHIIAIHDSPRRLLPDKHYLCIMAADTPDQNLSQYFSVCNDFIHAARLREGNVLIHCLAGMSRSVTVAVAYIMTATNLNWKEALKVVRTGRAVANPNLGFQTQLQEFEVFRLGEERRRLRERFPSSALEQMDRTKCVTALDNYQELLQNKDICEGNCNRGEKCPTGVCNMDPAKGIFRRRPSSTSTRSRFRAQPSTSAAAAAGSSRSLSVSNAAQSCPTSPSRNFLHRSSIDEERAVDDDVDRNRFGTSAESLIGTRATPSTLTAAVNVIKEEEHQKPSIASVLATQADASSRHISNTNKRLATGGRLEATTSSTTHSYERPRETATAQKDIANNGTRNIGLHRCASAVSGFVTRPRTAPAGLYSYTGSVPSSVHGSHVDLRDTDKGSAIYLGCSAPRNSTISLSSRGSSNNSSPPSPARTPPVSPRHGVRRSASLAKKAR